MQKTVKDIVTLANDGTIGDTVALLGGRFVSWVIARELEGLVDRVIISDTDPWVEKITVENLRSQIKTDLIRGLSNDQDASGRADTTIICSTIPAISSKISRDIKNSIALV